MPSYRQIKRRIRSVQNTAKITNALQLVAASKMRRAQMRAGAAKPYAERLRTVLANLAAQVGAGGEDEAVHPLLEQRTGSRVTLVVIAPNRGLSGGLPGNINRRVLQTIREQGPEAQIRAIAVGKKGRDFLVRGGFHVVAEYLDLGDYPSAADVSPIVREVIDDFLDGVTDRVLLIYPDFINTATQRPTVRQVLPVQPPESLAEREGVQIDYIYEPSAKEVLAQLLPRYIEMQIYEAVLQNVASFYSAQMVAMKNATDAANDMVDSLTLAANKARQEQITKELLDIVGGVAALEG
ncbi:MAG TPA: ATP synthase F1 subunit gamma [Dehalococcoidia bacterium]|nr:ATP synthase F1 subunit gamma [Dehalococcoidia bacterium]